jgi:hypothetical protein
VNVAAKAPTVSAETNHNCTDEAEWYMVKDEIWAGAVHNRPAQYLGIGCLEKRIGRQLTHSDFTQALVNHWPDRFCHSPRLRSRVAGFQFEVVRRVDGKPVQWKVCDEAELGRIIQREKELKVTCPWRSGHWDIPTADECKFMTTLQDRWNLIRSHLGCAYNVLGVKLPDEALFHQYMEHNEWELAWDSNFASVADSKPSWGHKDQRE